MTAVPLGEPVHPDLPYVRALHDLREARDVGSAGARVDALRRSAEALGDRLREEGPALAVRTFDVSDLVYPARFAFQGALQRPWPFVAMRHRCLLVQLQTEEGVRNLLFNPSDREASKATPYFEDLQARFPGAEAFLGTPPRPVEAQLADVGLTPEDIHLVAFDHFHTQDLRPLVGTLGSDPMHPPLPARYPNAKLLAPRTEWEDWADLHPMQRAWFVPEGRDDVDMDRVVLTDGDLHLAPGVALVQTPGHTSGNQTLFVATDEGVFGCSENGTSVDNWSPYESRLPGLKGHARVFDLEVVLNANTPESAAEQYASMIVERSVVDRVEEAPAFVQMFPSSEVIASVVAPGLRPTVSIGAKTHGPIARAHTARPRTSATARAHA